MLQHDRRVYNLANSTPAYALVSPKSNTSIAEGLYTVAHAEVPSVFLIEKGLQVSSPHLGRTARVLQSFYVKVGLDRGEFIATSGISDIYESGETKGLAVLNYLYSLIDEIVWFQAHKESLSEAMLEGFVRLQSYLSLV